MYQQHQLHFKSVFVAYLDKSNLTVAFAPNYFGFRKYSLIYAMPFHQSNY